jgi:hypothetical protein
VDAAEPQILSQNLSDEDVQRLALCRAYWDAVLTCTRGCHQQARRQWRQWEFVLAGQTRALVGHGGSPSQELRPARMRRHTWRNTLIGAGLLTAALAIGAGGGYWFGYHGAAEDRAGLSRALTGAQAAEWRDLIQMNDIASAPRQCGAQQGGEACAYTLWTKLPKAGQ